MRALHKNLINVHAHTVAPTMDACNGLFGIAPATVTVPAPLANTMAATARIGKHLGMMLAAPLIGLAFFIALPLIGFAMLAWMARADIKRCAIAVARIVKNALLFLAAPVVGGLYVLAAPFVGMAVLGWMGGRALVAK